MKPFDVASRVHILHKNYTVSECDNLHDEKSELLGEISYLTQEITLRSDASPDDKRVTLLHEILHGIDDVYGLKLEERQVDMLAKALYQLLRDNGWHVCPMEEQSE